MKIRFTLLPVFVLLLSAVHAQKITMKSGSLDVLKKGDGVTLSYEYEPMSVGKFKDVNDYIKTKKKEYNDKEPGRGDKWAESWVDDRTTRFEPKFEELLTEYTKSLKVQSPDAKYEMVVHTTFTEPGFNVGVMRKNAYIDLIVTIKDQSGKAIAEIVVDNAPGRDWGGYDFDTGYRIEEAYAKAGKSLGIYLSKQVK